LEVRVKGTVRCTATAVRCALLIVAGLGCAKSVDLDALSTSGQPSDGANGDVSSADASAGSADGATGAADAATGGKKDSGVSNTGTPGSVSYPTLNAAAIGMPTQVASGFTLAEGPLWDPCGKRLLFADVTASVINSLGSDGKVSMFMQNTNSANGLAFDVDGSIIMAQMGGHIARRKQDGTVQVLDPPGSMLHTPDDVIVRSDGTIYFSDGDFPPIGGLDFNPLPVYAFKPGAAKLVNGGTVMGPNGVELSPDEKTLYVDAYFEGSVVKFSVAADGTPTKGAALATGLTNPDSLCLDAAGNLYVGVSTGLQVLRPDGSMVTLIPVASAQGVTNCTFGGDDGKTLFITAWTAIWKVDAMPIPGLDWEVTKNRVHCGM
jgi:gluconolactonase